MTSLEIIAANVWSEPFAKEFRKKRKMTFTDVIDSTAKNEYAQGMAELFNKLDFRGEYEFTYHHPVTAKYRDGSKQLFRFDVIIPRQEFFDALSGNLVKFDTIFLKAITKPPEEYFEYMTKCYYALRTATKGPVFGALVLLNQNKVYNFDPDYDWFPFPEVSLDRLDYFLEDRKEVLQVFDRS